MRALLCLLCLVYLPAAFTQQECLKNLYGSIVCAPRGGVITKDTYGTIVCAKGQCVQDSFGRLSCAKELGGVATYNNFNIPICSGGCEPPKQELCGAELKP